MAAAREWGEEMAACRWERESAGSYHHLRRSRDPRFGPAEAPLASALGQRLPEEAARLVEGLQMAELVGASRRRGFAPERLPPGCAARRLQPWRSLVEPGGFEPPIRPCEGRVFPLDHGPTR